MNKSKTSFFAVLLILSLYSCASTRQSFDIDYTSATPSGSVTRTGKPLKLIGEPIILNAPLPSSILTDASTLKPVDLSSLKGKVLFLSIVPSIDTKVCEEQTHYLGEEGDRLSGDIERITISRDTPFAQKRFSEAAKLTDIQYLSDYKDGDFGKKTGLLIDDLRLLTRSVIVVDKEGIVRYIQVVSEITRFPDMETAFEKAIELSKR